MKRRRDLVVSSIHLVGGSVFFFLILLTDFEPLRYFSGFGVLLVFVAALLEAVYLIGLYFPGSVIMVAAILGAQTIQDVLQVMIVIWLGTATGLVVDVLIARQFPRLSGADVGRSNWLFGGWLPVVSAIHPNFSATYVFDQAAKHRLSLRKFGLLLAAAFVFLGVYSAVLASVGSLAQSEQRPVALVWACFVIGIGAWGLLSGVRSGRS